MSAYLQQCHIKSVQEEAGLSLGAAYRYPDIIDKIEISKNREILNSKKDKTLNEVDRLRKEKAKEASMKDKYRQELQITNGLLDKLYAEQAMQMMAMFNLLSNEDKKRLLENEQSPIVNN
ncbi:hypothetical protein VXR09_17915 [Acinetobacter baumannii]|uniref:hypothetical protein n=1 Tax=Acinetobacter calcoaceticus/baumannii complex TaxID=909768 RepID=UPI000AC29E68|nr:MULTISPECIES: hypothetical protein [Acinetobacter calcoaceticus/baumannii complex]MDQ9826887.1 hypothetical protein [Acinetobacter sp. 163]HBT1511164.1 hypothetical protein [Klebsiella pneumoniae]MCZ2969038.1 hypothetical protein [Acinetobacter baumannii]MDA3480651.1 hypothetical protein [Acinetobacter baumannii]MDA3505826.1 hypothetical protein [Acinetobacter baumannii]